MDKKLLLALSVLAMPALLLSLAMAEDITVNATVQPYLSVVFNYNTVDFGTVSVGTTDNHPTPDYTTGVYNVSVSANDNYQVTALESGGFVNNGLTLKLAVSTSPAVDGTFYSLTTASQTIYSGTAFYGTHYHQYKLDVGSQVAAGSYSTTVTITYSLV